MGSDSDLPIVQKAVDTLKEFGVPYEVHIFSAHRTPAEAAGFAGSAAQNGFGVLIAAAGMAAHLAGAVAAQTVLPVIGIPCQSNTLDGMDALLSTVQMPSGIPVATVAINGGVNAALLAIEMLAICDDDLRDKLTAKRTKDHDTVIKKDAEIASNGVHSNGFSLVRKVFDIENADLKKPLPELGGKSLGETLLTSTKIYVKPVLALLEKIAVKGISHITGGGFYENIPRSIPDGFGAVIPKADVRVLPIFDLIAKAGNISERDMFNTFNMGVGMSIVVAEKDADKALAVLQSNGEDAYVIGKIIRSDEKVIVC